MKELADGSRVTSRGFYFLLDWNDQNDKKMMSDLYGVMRLHELTRHQYAYMMKHAMADELKSLGNGQQK
jgi:DNA phosphorothioation-dependent restriction protein DptG